MKRLIFEPLLKRTRWGGRRLGTLLGKSLGTANDYAESWEICDLGSSQSVVADGEFKGKTLHQLIRRFPEELLGSQRRASRFPLLMKFLDVNDRLSVQVHPDDRQAEHLHLGQRGKTEAWVVMAAQPDCQIYVGLKTGIDRTQLESALRAGTIEECLHRVDVAIGDCLLVPAGTVHAIGEGILLAEIQQSSDVTFRLHDWGRVDTDGLPRTLHIESALDCIDFTRGPIDLQTPQSLDCKGRFVEELVRCGHFVIHRETIRESVTLPADDQFHILMVLRGMGTLDDGSTLTIGPGQSVLLPANRSPSKIIATEELTILNVFLP